MFAKLFEEDAKKETKTKEKDKDKKEDKEKAKRPPETVQYYCLSFTLTFDYNRDTVFIAYSRPYKYTQVILDIVKNENALMEQDPGKYLEVQLKFHWVSTCGTPGSLIVLLYLGYLCLFLR